MFHLLSRKQKREFLILQVFMLLASVAELVGTVSIMPFIALSANPDIVHTQPILASVHQYLGDPSHKDFLFIVGGIFIGLMVIANLVMMVSQFLMNRYSFRVGGEISARLYGYYLSRDILFHSATNSASLVQRIMRDSMILSVALIAPALRLNARLFSIILLTAMVIYVDPMVALNTVLVLVLVYWFIFHFVRRHIRRNGELISRLGEKRNQALNESFHGIRDIKLYSSEYGYLKRYLLDTKVSDRASADNLILGDSPYFIVETIIFAGMVLLTLYLYSMEGSLNSALPVLTLYGLSAIKIIPKVQQSYVAVTRIRSAQPVFEQMYEDMVASRKVNPFDHASVDVMRLRSGIEIRDLSFRFKGDRQPVFSHFSAEFRAGDITAITGSSGVGKSTLLEILMGLITPDSGLILVDGAEIPEDLQPDWRASIGYVPQDVYLSDATVAENIAFGVEHDKIDLERVKAMARHACIDRDIEELPDGYLTAVGERGGLLSGGQRQRIGIARALYRNVSILLLDEATSALDETTQTEILNKLAEYESDLTVIMITHRSETLAIADRVIYLDESNGASADVVVYDREEVRGGG